MRFFAEIQRVDEEQRMVWGYASTEQRATDGKVIKREAMTDALDDYMIFANVREMHQPSAVGRTDEAQVDDGGLYVGVKVVDDNAWKKVTERVYRGFSIGAKATAYDPVDRTIVTGLKIREISLVDRPADPGAVFDCYRADGLADSAAIETATGDDLDELAEAIGLERADGETDADLRRRTFTEAQRKKAAESGAAMPDGSYPIENRQDLENAIRAYGRAKNKRAVRRHIMKRARALGATDLIPEDWKTMARDAGAAEASDETIERADEAQGDAPQTEPPEGEGVEELDLVARAVQGARTALERVDEAVEAVTRAAEPEGEALQRAELPGAELRRGLYSVGRLGSLVSELAYMAMDAQFEADVEGDNSPVPGKLRAALLELAKAYKAMSDEELAEMLNGVGVDVQLENGVILLCAAAGGLERADGAGLNETQGSRLAAAFEAFTARGWTLPQRAEDPAEVADLRRSVESLTTDRDLLLRSHEELTGRLGDLADTVTRLSNTVVPARTAGALARAIDKGDDAAGAGAETAVTISQEDVQRYLADLPEQDRAHLLMRAAMARPLAVAR